MAGEMLKPLQLVSETVRAHQLHRTLDMLNGLLRSAERDHVEKGLRGVLRERARSHPGPSKIVRPGDL